MTICEQFLTLIRKKKEKQKKKKRGDKSSLGYRLRCQVAYRFKHGEKKANTAEHKEAEGDHNDEGVRGWGGGEGEVMVTISK